MTPADAALLLAVAATLDPRLRPTNDEDAQLRSQAWAAVLDSDMPPKFGRDAIAAHYAEATSALMPADLNRAWRKVRQQHREEQQRVEALARRQQEELNAVPMPAEVRQQIRRMIERTSREK